MALILAVPRRIAEGDALARSGDWRRAGRRPVCLVTSMVRRGLLAWAVLAVRWRGGPAALACRSIITTCFVHPQTEAELEATYWDSLEQMLARVDIVSSIARIPRPPSIYAYCRVTGWR